MERSKKNFVSIVFPRRIGTFLLYILPPLALIVANSSELLHYASSNYASLDGYGHMAAGEYYLDHIFPNTWAWVSAWSFGMPFPVFYPPLPHIIAGLLAKVIHVPFETALNTLLVVASVALPAVVARAVFRISRQRGGAVAAGLLTALFLSLDGYAYYGVVLAGTFGVGLYGQLIGVFFTILWLPDFLETHRRTAAFARASVFFALAVLSNVHALPVLLALAAADAFISFVLKWREWPSELRAVGMRILSALFGFLLAAFWWLPALAVSGYQASHSLAVASMSRFTFLCIPFIASAVVALAIGIRVKDGRLVALALAPLGLIALVFAHVERLFPDMPIHVYRYAPAAFLLSVVALSSSLTPLSTLFLTHARTRIYRYSCIAIGAVLVISFIPETYHSRYTIHSEDFDRNTYREIADKIELPAGPVLVEYDDVDEAGSYSLGAELARRGIPVAFTILRESSPTSMFTIPLRNSFSRSRESAGVFSLLAYYTPFLTRSINERLNQARNFGISYIVTRSRDMEKQFSGAPDVEFISRSGPWTIRRLENTAPQAEILPYKPAGVFSDLGYGGRDTASIDYARMEEEMMRGDYTDVILTYPHDQRLDGTTYLHNFSSLIIARYKYGNLKKAETLLMGYIKDGGTIYLYEERDPLFDALTSLAPEGRVHIVRKRFIGPYRDPAGELGTFIQSLPKVPTGRESARIAGTSLNDKSISVQLSEGRTIFPVLIRSSFFPAWRGVGLGDPILAGPNFMVVFTNKTFSLQFNTPTAVPLGYIISLVTLLALIAVTRLRRERPADMPQKKAS